MFEFAYSIKNYLLGPPVMLDILLAVIRQVAACAILETRKFIID